MLSLGLWLKDRERRKEGRKEGREGGKSWAEGKEIKKKNGNSVILDEFNLMFSLLALALYLGEQTLYKLQKVEMLRFVKTFSRKGI